MGNDNLLRELDAILVGGGGRVGDNLRWSSILWGGGEGTTCDGVTFDAGE